MSLGSFLLGSTVRLPLQITEGGIPVTDVSSVKVQKVILPNKQIDTNFPKNMSLVDSSGSVYFLDYIPQAIGNYVVIYSFHIESVMFSAIDSFYVSSAQSSIPRVPRAEPVSSKNPSARGL